MFGVIRPCRHLLGEELATSWTAHLCGQCVGLRETHGQGARVLTNTDAAMVSVMVEAQSARSAVRMDAGRCALRRLTAAEVVAPSAVGSRLGVTTSLTLSTAKMTDRAQESGWGLAPASPLREKAAKLMADGLRRRALADVEMAEALHVPVLLGELADQGRLESTVATGQDLVALVRPSAVAAGQVFATTAMAAENPGNADALRVMGEAFGSLAHLLDAADDYESDAQEGRFNPVSATGATLRRTERLCWALHDQIAGGFERLVLTDGRLLQALLIESLRSTIARTFDARSETCVPCGQGTVAGRRRLVDLCASATPVKEKRRFVDLCASARPTQQKSV